VALRDTLAVVDDEAATTVMQQGPPAEVAAAVASEGKPDIAGYDLVRELGRGGMGVVWEAIEHRFDRRVAVKVHVEARPKRDDLSTEARIAARIGDPGIVRVLDVGHTLDGRTYFSMELVDGTDLSTLLAHGPLSDRRAVAFGADIARAVAAAHRHGIIHRDLKPRNIMIDVGGRARVLDFGIALDAKSGPDRLAGKLAGSPMYMAPEQVLGREITPATDVFALGVILYQMLTGTRPFTGSLDQILAAVVHEHPPAPSTIDPAIHTDLDAVVLRCMSKAPGERYLTAGALFETLSAIEEGSPIEVAARSPLRQSGRRPGAVVPSTRPRRDDAKKHLSWSWKLRSSPTALWPFVADTDRCNEATGTPAVSFVDRALPGGGVERTGDLRVLGLSLRWREYPFEWVAFREHSVFRAYRSGPVSALWNRVSLTPLADGGTELTHELWVTPRGVTGAVASYIQLERKFGPALDRLYRRLDEVLVTGAAADPFEEPHRPTAAQRRVVETGCARLRGDGIAASLLEKLANHLLTAPRGALATMRPYELADAWSEDRAAVLELMIHAAHDQLLEPTWDVVCPKCMIAHESVPALERVSRAGACSACASSFERDLRDGVELVFMPHPTVREIERVTYCAGAPAKRPHILAQQVLEPGEERAVIVELPRGTYRVAGDLAATPWELLVSAVGFETHCEIEASGGRIEGRPAVVRAGEVALLLRNATDRAETFRIEIPGARHDAVSAAVALTNPSFRLFFSAHVPARGEHLPVKQLAFLFVEVLRREALFDKRGDDGACAELSRVDEIVRTEAYEHEGTLVPSSRDRLVAAFATPLQAARAAIAVRARVAHADLSAPVAIAVHEGRCLALTRDDQPEFFGETLHKGQALLRDCPEGGIALSTSVTADRGVAIALQESGLTVGVAITLDGPYVGRRVTTLRPEHTR
jgi:serine/threonine protein kinase